MSIRVIIAGFKGKMGQAACQMVLADPDLDLVAVWILLSLSQNGRVFLFSRIRLI